METWAIVISAMFVTSTFWLGFFIVYDDKLKKIERQKIEKLFKDKKW